MNFSLSAAFATYCQLQIGPYYGHLPGGLQSMGSQSVEHDRATKHIWPYEDASCAAALLTLHTPERPCRWRAEARLSAIWGTELAGQVFRLLDIFRC